MSCDLAAAQAAMRETVLSECVHEALDGAAEDGLLGASIGGRVQGTERDDEDLSRRYQWLRR